VKRRIEKQIEVILDFVCEACGKEWYLMVYCYNGKTDRVPVNPRLECHHCNARQSALSVVRSFAVDDPPDVQLARELAKAALQAGAESDG